MDQKPEERTLGDIQAITEVLYQYCFLMDKMELDSLAALFTPDCIVEYGSEERWQSRSSAELRKKWEGLWRFVRTFHLVSNVLVRIDGDGDGASAQSAVYAWHERPDGSTSTELGQYEDRLVRRDGRWLIAKRRQFLLGNDAGFDGPVNRFERREPPGGA